VTETMTPDLTLNHAPLTLPPGCHVCTRDDTETVVVTTFALEPPLPLTKVQRRVCAPGNGCNEQRLPGRHRAPSAALLAVRRLAQVRVPLWRSPAPVEPEGPSLLPAEREREPEPDLTQEIGDRPEVREPV
jgi:hypothetical protein